MDYFTSSCCFGVGADLPSPGQGEGWRCVDDVIAARLKSIDKAVVESECFRSGQMQPATGLQSMPAFACYSHIVKPTPFIPIHTPPWHY